MMAVRFKAWVCGRSHAGTAGSNHTGGADILFLGNIVCCEVAASATGRSLVQRSPTECVCVFECDQMQHAICI